jgi:hypothetical protein
LPRALMAPLTREAGNVVNFETHKDCIKNLSANILDQKTGRCHASCVQVTLTQLENIK